MNRKQKIILAILALADVVVIVGLAVFAVRRSRSLADANASEAAAPSDCVGYLLDSMSLTGGAPRVSLQQDDIFLEIVFVGPGNAVGSSPQIIWTVLDSLSPSFQQLCGVPETVTINIEMNAGPGHRQFTARLPGDALVSWLRGLMSDEELSELSRYRMAATTPPQDPG